jgi:hypothetical protein
MLHHPGSERFKNYVDARDDMFDHELASRLIFNVEVEARIIGTCWVYCDDSSSVLAQQHRDRVSWRLLSLRLVKAQSFEIGKRH